MPVPPTGVAGLTSEELRALEGHERQPLEALLQSLRNIHMLLDAAAMLQINQYLAVLASFGAPQASYFSHPTEEAASAVVSAAPSTSVPSSDSPSPPPGASSTAPEAEKPLDPELVGGSAAEEPPKDGEPDAAELRRRHLQKLESPVAH